MASLSSPQPIENSRDEVVEMELCDLRSKIMSARQALAEIHNSLLLSSSLNSQVDNEELSQLEQRVSEAEYDHAQLLAERDTLSTELDSANELLWTAQKELKMAVDRESAAAKESADRQCILESKLLDAQREISHLLQSEEENTKREKQHSQRIRELEIEMDNTEKELDQRNTLNGMLEEELGRMREERTKSAEEMQRQLEESDEAMARETQALISAIAAEKKKNEELEKELEAAAGKIEQAENEMQAFKERQEKEEKRKERQEDDGENCEEERKTTKECSPVEHRAVQIRELEISQEKTTYEMQQRLEEAAAGYCVLSEELETASLKIEELKKEKEHLEVGINEEKKKLQQKMREVAADTEITTAIMKSMEEKFEVMKEERTAMGRAAKESEEKMKEANADKELMKGLLEAAEEALLSMKREQSEMEKRMGEEMLEKERLLEMLRNQHLEDNSNLVYEMRTALLLLEDKVEKLEAEREDAQTFLAEAETRRMELEGRLLDAEQETFLLREYTLRNTEEAGIQKKGEETIRHLERDNMSLEQQLSSSSAELLEARAEIEEKEKALIATEEEVLSCRRDISRLTEELDRNRFELSQLLRAQSNEDGARMRVIELERELTDVKYTSGQRVEQIYDELRIAEEKLKMCEEDLTASQENASNLENKMMEWRTRFEDSMGECESLRRAIDEVNHLEKALQKSHEEREAIGKQLIAAISDSKQLTEEKEAALAQMHALTEQLALRTERLLRAGEERNATMQKMVELESKLNALQREREANGDASLVLSTAKKESSAALLSASESGCSSSVQWKNEGHERSTPRERELELQLTAALGRISQMEAASRIPSTAIDMPTNGDSEDDDETDRAPLDPIEEHYLSSSRVVSASSPLPSLPERISRWLRVQSRAARHSRLLRDRAVLPYARYAGAAYFVFLQIVFVRYLFFAGC